MRDAGHRTPDAGRRTPDIGHRTSDGEKSKNNISTPQGGGHNNLPLKETDTPEHEHTLNIMMCIVEKPAAVQNYQQSL